MEHSSSVSRSVQGAMIRVGGRIGCVLSIDVVGYEVVKGAQPQGRPPAPPEFSAGRQRLSSLSKPWCEHPAAVTAHSSLASPTHGGSLLWPSWAVVCGLFGCAEVSSQSPSLNRCLIQVD